MVMPVSWRGSPVLQYGNEPMSNEDSTPLGDSRNLLEVVPQTTARMQNPVSSSLPMKKRKTRLECPNMNNAAMNGSSISTPSEAPWGSSVGGGGYTVAKTFVGSDESRTSTRYVFSNEAYSTPGMNAFVVSKEITPRNNSAINEYYEVPTSLATEPEQSPVQQHTKKDVHMQSSKPVLKIPGSASTKRKKKHSMEQGNDRKRAAPTQEAEGGTSKKKRASKKEAEGGTPEKKRSSKKGAKYTDDEVDRLLEAAGSVQPKNDFDWEMVKLGFEASAPPGAPIRSIVSLKCKLTTVALKLVMNALANKASSVNALDADALGVASKKKIDTASSDDSVSDILAIINNASSFEDNGETPRDDNTLDTFPNSLFADLDAEISLGNEKIVIDKNDNHDTIVQEAEKLSDSMIKFFEKFGSSDGMVLQNDALDSLLARVKKIECDVVEMKGALANVHANTSAILSALHYRNGGYHY